MASSLAVQRILAGKEKGDAPLLQIGPVGSGGLLCQNFDDMSWRPSWRLEGAGFPLNLAQCIYRDIVEVGVAFCHEIARGSGMLAATQNGASMLSVSEGRAKRPS